MARETEPSKSETRESPTSKDPANDGNDDNDGLPVDRGFAWVIVFCCLACNILCLGMQRAIGILFVEFLVLFQMSAGETTLILAAQSGCTSVAALLTQTVVLSLLSERQTMILGGFFGGLGFFLSAFATSLYHLLFTQSLLVGMSLAMIYGPSCVIVNQYFHKRRSLATAFNALGGNIGSMGMPVLTQALLTLYGVRGSLLVLGGVYLHACVAASLLRPFEQYRRRLRRREKHHLKNAQPTDQVPLNADMTANDEDTGSHPACQDVPRPHHVSTAEPALHISTRDLFNSTEEELVFEGRGSDNVQDENNEEETTLIWTKQNNGTAASVGDRRSLVENSPEDSQDRRHDRESKLSVQSGVTAASKQEGSERDRESPNEPASKQGTRCAKLLNMFDFHMFKQMPFWVIASSFTLMYLPATLFGTYLPAMAVDKGVTGQRAALLLTIFGGCGLFARIGFGWFADLNYIPRYSLVACLMTVACTVGLFTPLYTEFAHLAVFSASYGVFGVVVFSIFPVVMVDLLGLRGMSKAFGFVQLFQGVFIAVSHPIIGHLRDITGNYHASYYFMSSAGLLCAAILMLTPLAVRHEKRKLNRTEDAEAAELADVKRPLKS